LLLWVYESLVKELRLDIGELIGVISWFVLMGVIAIVGRR